MAKAHEYNKPINSGNGSNYLVYLISIIKVKNCFISLTVAHRAKIPVSSILTPGATSGTLGNGQVSCPNMAILKIGVYLRNRCLQIEKKLNFDPLGEQDIIHMCSFWNFGEVLSFMPKYGNFENWPISGKPLPTEGK